MHDPNAPVPATLTAASAPARPRRRWLTALVYLLAGVGVLTLAFVAFLYYLHAKEESTPKRVAIDEAAVIDKVMGETYGKYSDAKKGWLYVGDENITYVMRVVQQAKIPDGADGDELYFVASGADVAGSSNAVYGVFYVHPKHPYDGTLEQSSMQMRYASSVAVRPEQVHFEALSENLWGWVVKTQNGTDPKEGPVTTVNTVLAPHGGEIATLGAFMASREVIPGIPCEEAKAAWDTYRLTLSADAPEDLETRDEPERCDKRRWTYHTATVNGNIPVPITVTLGGQFDGQAVEPRSWKLMFDPKNFSYDVPDELLPAPEEASID
jgi:hypothetical protein